MKIVATEKAPKALGPYSQGYVHNGVLYTAGQIAINPEVNDVEATTIEAQTEQFGSSDLIFGMTDNITYGIQNAICARSIVT